MTANVQTPTVRQVAQIMGVSERTIYYARRMRRLRPDLFDRMRAGELSLHAARRIAEDKPMPTSWDRLVTAWNNATDEDRAKLLRQVLGPDDTEGGDDAETR